MLSVVVVCRSHGILWDLIHCSLDVGDTNFKLVIDITGHHSRMRALVIPTLKKTVNIIHVHIFLEYVANPCESEPECLCP